MSEYSDWNIPKPKPPPKNAGIILAGVGALLMIASAFSHAWLVPRRNSFMEHVGVSPLSIHAGDESKSNFSYVSEQRDRLSGIEVDIPGVEPPSSGWPLAGLLTFIFQLVGGVGAAATAVLAWRGLRPATPIAATTVAVLGSLVALVCGAVFVIAKPSDMDQLVIGWGFWAFGLGSVGALVGAQFLAKHIQPVDPDLV